MLLRSCHLVGHTPSTVLPKPGDELHVTISVTNGDTISGTPHRDANVSASEPIHEDFLNPRKVNSGSMFVHKIKIPLCEYNNSVTIEDVATSPLFHSTDEISVFCVLVNQGVSSSSPLYSAYSKVSALQSTSHPDVQVVQHVGLRVCGDSVGTCLTIAKAPNATDRGIESALATEHMRCFHEHIVNWQLERALQTKNAAVEELIHSDILLSDEIKRQRLSFDNQPVPLNSGDEVALLKARVKELELERVRELEAMRKLIAERRAEREAHIEARLKDNKAAVNTRTPLSSRAGLSQSTTGKVTPLRNVTPQRGALASRTGVTTPLRGAPAASRNSTPTRGVVPSSVGVRTPQRSGTPTRSSQAAAPSARRSSVASPVAKSPTNRSVSGAPTPNQAILKRAEDNLMRLRGDNPMHSTSTSKLTNSVGSRPANLNASRTASPTPGRVPPPPPDIRGSSPIRPPPASVAASSRRSTITPTRSSTPTGKLNTTPGAANSGVRSASLIKNNTQSLIRMARQ